jgi:Ca-activated chloride channel family protein
MQRALALLSAFSLLAGAPVRGAARDSGVITGTVADESRAALPGAAVALTRGTEAPRTTTTNGAGEFRFDGLPPGRYSLSATLPGFMQAVHTVVLGRAERARVALTLRVASVAETITVAAGPSITLSCPAKGTPRYARIDENPFRSAEQHPLSTFSIDVDTASYANVRRFLNDGELPPKDAVRIEELLNYFPYDYPAAADGAAVALGAESAACPWNPEHVLVLVSLRGRPLAGPPPPRNLVFLLDVSGSMDDRRRLPLLKAAFARLVGDLNDRDRVAIVVYAGAAGLVLPPTPGDRAAEILGALERLQAGGSTNGGDGIELAYRVARQSYVRDGVNRVILATDGDFNVGVTGEGDLTRLIEKQRRSGVFLSVLGFGDDNLNDSTMEALADRGDGNYAYIDSLREAEKVLRREAAATLVTAARDVKVQVEFNPARVAAYRLLGYENRLLEAEDFRDDARDAGEIGAGGAVTALYEVVPRGRPVPRMGEVDPLKYQERPRVVDAGAGELMTVKVRFKAPTGGRSRALETVVHDGVPAEPSPNVGFASAVAAFGMLLRDSPQRGTASYDSVLEWARRTRGADPHGERQEFEELVARAAALSSARMAAGQE